MLPQLAGKLRVQIDSPDPMVAASLAAALSGAADVELTHAPEPSALLLWDAGATPALMRKRIASLPAERSALVLVAAIEDAPFALAAGAQGVLLRELDRERLLSALWAIAHGLLVLDPSMAVRAQLAAADARELGQQPLTAREREVLQLVADGLSNRRIATRLAVSEHTVKFHVNAILEKLGADSRTQAVVTAVRRGLLWL